MALGVWKGNLQNKDALLVADAANDRTVINMIISNNSASVVVTLNVFLLDKTVLTRISPRNLQIAVGEAYADRDIIILKGQQIKITVTGDADYYLSII